MEIAASHSRFLLLQEAPLSIVNYCPFKQGKNYYPYTTMPPRNIKKILIWGNNWIGDVICSLPAVYAIKERYPDSTITIIVRSPSHELLLHNPIIDTVLSFNKNDRLKKTVSLLKKLRRQQFDIAFIFPNSFRAALLVYLTGAKDRIGYNTELRTFLLTRPIPHPKDLPPHLADFFQEIALGGGCKKWNNPVTINNSQEDETFAAAFLKKQKDIPDNPFFICLHPGTSKPPRAWNSEKFGELCQILTKEYPTIHVLVIGNKKEYNSIEPIKTYAKGRVTLACDDLSLGQICALIKRCTLFIGNDSGMMHIASVLTLPTVALFGPDIPERTGAFCNKELFYPVTRRFSCSPCRQKFFKDCPPTPNNKALCIEAITVWEVLEVVKPIIRKILR